MTFENDMPFQNKAANFISLYKPNDYNKITGFKWKF